LSKRDVHNASYKWRLQAAAWATGDVSAILQGRQGMTDSLRASGPRGAAAVARSSAETVQFQNVVRRAHQRPFLLHFFVRRRGKNER
jgi:hypothetical protein